MTTEKVKQTLKSVLTYIFVSQIDQAPISNVKFYLNWMTAECSGF